MALSDSQSLVDLLRLALREDHARLTAKFVYETELQSEVRSAVEAAAADPEIAVLLITEKLAALCGDLIIPMKQSAQRPLVVEIPDRHSAGRSPDSITRYIREAIGVKL